MTCILIIARGIRPNPSVIVLAESAREAEDWLEKFRPLFAELASEFFELMPEPEVEVLTPSHATCEVALPLKPEEAIAVLYSKCARFLAYI